ncbi:hypothetical protein M413DRAFT_7503 [Hebeloma cylindrosporum]|uniref:Uncharacterized protein n=1 Tax=Hebeloma cylindrosporum TaxID=76867 RepID=A0A0C2Z0S2_HEBCY|nr:hypothetical protein M413DRAFT_7503 [Hebeloma cylindrosporum h7]
MSSSTIFPAPTDTPSSTNIMAQRGANYFFGFLIAFVVLFLIFVGCGIGSRRRLLAERREGSFTDAWGMSRYDAEQKRPTFYEYPLGVPVRVDQWEDIMPLSAVLWRRPPKEPSEDAESVVVDPAGTYSPPHSDLEAARGEPATPYSIFSGFALPQWRSTDKEPPDPDEKSDELPEEMNVAVLIAMPCSVNDCPATFQGTDVARLTECQIGTTIVPWHPEVSGTLLSVLSRTGSTPHQ